MSRLQNKNLYTGNISEHLISMLYNVGLVKTTGAPRQVNEVRLFITQTRSRGGRHAGAAPTGKADGRQAASNNYVIVLTSRIKSIQKYSIEKYSNISNRYDTIRY